MKCRYSGLMSGGVSGREEYTMQPIRKSWELSEIIQKVTEQTAEAFERAPETISPKTRFLADLAAESIDFVDLTFRVERVFGIKIPEGEFFDADPKERPVSIQDVANYVAGKLKEPVR